MKKTPSALRRTLRELQLIGSVGAAVLILYAVAASSLVGPLSAVNVENHGARLVMAALFTHGLMALVAAGVCYAVRRIIEIDPWRLAVGSVFFAEAVLLLLRWVSGGFGDDGGLDPELGVELAFAVVGAIAAGFAGKAAARAADAQVAKVAADAPPPGPDLAEQMRRIQEQESAKPAAPDLAEQMRRAQEEAAAAKLAGPAAEGSAGSGSAPGSAAQPTAASSETAPSAGDGASGVPTGDKT